MSGKTSARELCMPKKMTPLWSLLVTSLVLANGKEAHAIDFDFKVGGYVKLDTVVSMPLDGRLAAGSFARDFYVPSLTPIGGDGNDPVVDLHARQTRVFLKGSAEIAEGETIDGYVEVDFMVNPSGNERISNSFAPRMRHAFLKYGGLLAGQTWSTFQDVKTLPESVDFIGTTDGVVFCRQAMLRYSIGGLDLALENPETTVTPNGGGARIVTDDNYVPDLVARYTAAGDWGHVSFAAIGRTLAIQNVGASGTTNTIGGGAALGVKLKLGGDDLRLTAIGGTGLGRYVALNFANDVVLRSGNKPEAIPLVAGSLAFRHVWSERWRTNIMASAIRVLNDTDLTGNQVGAWSMSSRINLMHQPVASVVLGLEYGFALREREDGEQGQLHRLQFAAKLSF
jgi:hypothetical protein